ncbi:secretion protein EspA [Edwardsiella anguillarum]|uniref:secretion protein EspA n=1 Tax=Edwardsiella anguillarum TaxID=1821960 RepID=UPI0024B758E7|nr:secretion protein EspA [Edwardsiella anguillarum]WHQ17439.1 secretion protein EspA [Edwardsiella anguillarum]
MSDISVGGGFQVDGILGYDLSSMSKADVQALFEKVGAFQAAIMLFSSMYSAQSKMTTKVFAEMNEASKASTEAQKMENLVDAKIADVQSSSDKNTKVKLPQEVIDYINDPSNEIKISGLSVGLTEAMGAGDLQTVKAALGAKANNLTSVVNSNQLQIQQLSNTLNLMTSTRSDLQSLQYRTISGITIGK